MPFNGDGPACFRGKVTGNAQFSLIDQAAQGN